MLSLRSKAWLALLAATSGCAGAMVESELEIRKRLQAEHAATLLLELRGQLTAAAMAAGITSVTCWWDEIEPAVTGTVDESGSVRVAVSSFDVHIRSKPDPTVLHLVDRAGAHWHCVLDLDEAPPSGAFDLGELRLTREPDAPTVVDDDGRPLAGARFLLDPGVDRRWVEGMTDATGRVPLCRAVPIGPSARLIVRHEDFAPWWGALTDHIELDHGVSVRGRAVLPPTIDPADVMASVWVKQAAPRFIQGDAPYADVRAPIGRDGMYVVQNVPRGTGSVGVVDRLTSTWLGPREEVDVDTPATVVPDVGVRDGERTSTSMRLRLVDDQDRPVRGGEAKIFVSDVVLHVPLRNGYLDWDCEAAESFGVAVLGYAEDPVRVHRTGETIQLHGGHRVRLRLALGSARRLPAGCSLRVSIDSPALSPFLRPAPMPMAIDRDADLLVPEPGSYSIDLELVRWDPEERAFREVSVDVEPSGFDVIAGDSTIVTIASNLVEQR